MALGTLRRGEVRPAWQGRSRGFLPPPRCRTPPPWCSTRATTAPCASPPLPFHALRARNLGQLRPVHDRHQVRKSAAHRNMRDARAPNRIRPVDRQVPQQVGTDPVLGMRNRRPRPLVDRRKPSDGFPISRCTRLRLRRPDGLSGQGRGRGSVHRDPGRGGKRSAEAARRRGRRTGDAWQGQGLQIMPAAPGSPLTAFGPPEQRS